MTKKQKWSYLWRHLYGRLMISEAAAKHAAALAIEWLEKHEKPKVGTPDEI